MLNIFRNYYIMNSLKSIPYEFEDFIIYNGIPFFNYYQFIKFNNLMNKFILPSNSNCFNEFKEYNKQIFQEIKKINFSGYLDNFKNRYGEYEILKFWLIDNDNTNLNNVPLSISIIRNANSFLSLDYLPHDYYLPLILKKVE